MHNSEPENFEKKSYLRRSSKIPCQPPGRQKYLAEGGAKSLNTALRGRGVNWLHFAIHV